MAPLWHGWFTTLSDCHEAQENHTQCLKKVIHDECDALKGELTKQLSSFFMDLRTLLSEREVTKYASCGSAEFGLCSEERSEHGRLTEDLPTDTRQVIEEIRVCSQRFQELIVTSSSGLLDSPVLPSAAHNVDEEGRQGVSPSTLSAQSAARSGSGRTRMTSKVRSEGPEFACARSECRSSSQALWGRANRMGQNRSEVSFAASLESGGGPGLEARGALKSPQVLKPFEQAVPCSFEVDQATAVLPGGDPELDGHRMNSACSEASMRMPGQISERVAHSTGDGFDGVLDKSLCLADFQSQHSSTSRFSPAGTPNVSSSQLIQVSNKMSSIRRDISQSLTNDPFLHLICSGSAPMPLESTSEAPVKVTVWLPLLERTCGVLPWRPHHFQRCSGLVRAPAVWYQLLVLLMMFLSFAHGVKRHIDGGFSFATLASPRSVVVGSNLCDLVVALGTSLSHVALLARAFLDVEQGLLICQLKLTRFAEKQNFLAWWKKRNRRDTLALLSLWVAAVGLRTAFVIRCVVDSGSPVLLEHFICIVEFALSTLGLFAVVSVVGNMSTGLTQAVDTYCCDVAVELDAASAMASWNVTQAVLRSTALCLEGPFVCLQLTFVFAVLTMLAEVIASSELEQFDLVLLLPQGLILCGVVWAFVRAVRVTDTCNRVSSLVNTFTFADDDFLGRARRTVVDYISASTAGFFVLETRLDSTMLVKGLYVLLALAFATTTTFLR